MKTLAGSWEITWNHTQAYLKKVIGEKFLAEISEKGDVFAVEERGRKIMQLTPCVDKMFPRNEGMIFNF